MKEVRFLNYASAALALIIVIMTFLPYWKSNALALLGIDMSSSIEEFVWFPDSQPLLEEYFSYRDIDYTRNNLALPFVAFFLLCLASSIFCLLYNNKLLIALLPIATGLTGSLVFLYTPAFKLGVGVLYGAILILNITLVVVGVATVALGLNVKENA